MPGQQQRRAPLVTTTPTPSSAAIAPFDFGSNAAFSGIFGGPSTRDEGHSLLSALGAGTGDTSWASETPAAPTTGLHSRRGKDDKLQRQIEAVYKDDEKRATDAKPDLSKDQKGDVAAFDRNWAKNEAHYQAVADKAGVPAKLVAALHWREGSGDFGTYLQNGDPLGKPTTHVPVGKNFSDWDEAAIDALKDKQAIADGIGLTKDTTDLGAEATYAEFYNGLGYHNRGVPSPYAFSGTDQYTRGKYVGDGDYSAKTKDQQVGVMALIQSLDAPAAPNAAPATKNAPPVVPGRPNSA